MAEYACETPRTFDLEDREAWIKHLDEQGYVVLGNVLEPIDHATIFKQFAEDWTYVTPRFDFYNKKTWTTDNSPMMWNKGMIYASGLGQANFMWQLRMHERILSIWERVHGTRELVTSFDGFSVFLDRKQKPGIWLHVDQRSEDSLYSIQGAYNFLPVGEHDAGFVVVPGSHRTFVSNPNCRGQFIRIPDEDPHVERAVKLLIPGNSFVLWNSKTIHANVGMSKPKGREFNRLTTYIAMFPKAQRPKDIEQKRLAGYRNAHNCGHYAIRHDVKGHPYGLKARYEGRGFRTIEPELTAEGDIPLERSNLI